MSGRVWQGSMAGLRFVTGYPRSKIYNNTVLSIVLRVFGGKVEGWAARGGTVQHSAASIIKEEPFEREYDDT